jgi:hypothetical protein
MRAKTKFGQMATKKPCHKEVTPGVTTRRRHGRGSHAIENRIGVGLFEQQGNDPVAVDCVELDRCICLVLFLP